MAQQMDEEYESEFSSDRVVVWESSQWSTPTKQFPVVINVIEEEGKLLLDQSRITWTTPEDKFAFGFPRPLANSAQGKALQNKPIQIDSQLEDMIRKVNYDNANYRVSGDTVEERYASLVTAITNMWNTEKKPNGQPISTQGMTDMTGLSKQTWQNLLHVSYFAGLFMPAHRGKTTKRDTAPLTSQQKKHVEEFEAWKNQRPDENLPESESPVNIWITKERTAKDVKNQKLLHKAMKIMQVSPVYMLNLANEKPHHIAIEKLNKLLAEKKMPDPRNEKNILPKRLMVKDNEGDLVVPPTLVTPKGFPKVWFYGRWSQRYAGRSQEGKKGKAIYYPKTNANQYVKTLWSLKDWGDSFDAPDPFGKVIPDGKFKGVWMGTTRSNLTIEAINRDDNNSFYDMVGVIRQFMDAQGMGIGDQPETSNLAQVANVPRSATIHLKVREIETMNNCLIAGLNGQITEFDDWETFDIKAERIKFKDVEEAKSFWHDAYFYFRLGLNLGFRAEEAFTLVAKKLDTSVIGSAKEGESGVFEFPNDDMSVTLYQRKAEKGKKGQKIHGGYIVDAETKSMVFKRLKDVEDAKNVSSEIALKKYGIVKEHNDEPYLQHSLIGADGRYTELGTLDLPASAFTEKEKERGTVKPTAQRSKVRAMMRHCYHEAGLKDDYWYKHSLHSVRHVFAQYWLSLSDYNYGFVADIGHWQTESIVKTVYGKKTDTATLAQMTKYAGEDPIEKLRKQEQESAKAPSAVTQFSQQNYGSNEGDLQIQDKKLRQEIYFKGGYYYDVRLPDNERSITQIYYPKGTDLAFKDKTLNKDKVLFKFATKIDSDQKEDLDK